jgi:UDP-N-acetylmuramate--alanine ligase
MLGSCRVPLFGSHNALNATAAIACGLELGLGFDVIASAVESFGGVGRRLESKGEHDVVLVFDDYGHHPTELGVTLDALRDAYGDRPLTVIFQPHRYTRTRDHHEEFAAVLSKADRVGLLPIYAASEKPIVGVSSEMIVDRLRAEHGVQARVLTNLEDACGWAREVVNSGEILLTQGAGDVTRLAQMLADSFGERMQEGA